MKLQYKCKCGKTNTRKNIGYAETGVNILHKVTFDKNGEIIKYYNYDNEYSYTGKFYCMNCGKTLTKKEQELLKIKL